MREMDQNRKCGTVTGMPGVAYWQDGCFYDSFYKFVKSEYGDVEDPAKDTLKEAMSEVVDVPESREPGSMAYKAAYKEAMKLSVSALKAAAAKLAASTGGKQITVFSGAGSKQKNAKTVAMFG